MWRIAAFVSLGAATFGIGWGLDRAGLPSAYLFAALLVGLAVALALPGRVIFPGHHTGAAAGGSASTLGDARGWLLSIAVAVAGALVARFARVTAGALLGPMILAAVVVMAIPGGEFTVPTVLAQTAFALIGLQVGLRFTPETVRTLGRLLL